MDLCHINLDSVKDPGFLSQKPDGILTTHPYLLTDSYFHLWFGYPGWILIILRASWTKMQKNIVISPSCWYMYRERERDKSNIHQVQLYEMMPKRLLIISIVYIWTRHTCAHVHSQICCIVLQNVGVHRIPSKCDKFLASEQIHHRQIFGHAVQAIIEEYGAVPCGS